MFYNISKNDVAQTIDFTTFPKAILLEHFFYKVYKNNVEALLVCVARQPAEALRLLHDVPEDVKLNVLALLDQGVLPTH